MTPNKRIKTSDTTKNSLPITIRVPTFPDKKVTELNLQSMEEEDLKLLKEKDPFLYYSIPGVNKAALSLKEVDLSKASQSAQTVTRKARIAFECHPSLAMDELFAGLEESELDDGGYIELLYKTQ